MKSFSRLIRIIAAVLLSWILIQSCSLIMDMEPEFTGPVSGKLDLGSVTTLGNFDLGVGESVSIGSEGLEVGLEDMELTQVLENSSTISISAAPINGHSYGDLITPISPLISVHVTNETNTYEKLYKLSIPLEDAIAEDEFMMAFYYNANTGELEGIPTVEYEPKKLTIATSHFSDFFITKVKLALLPDKIFTGFKPEIDGWPYTNYGTYYNPGGICAGMSLTAMYVYAHHGGNLYQLADNDQSPENPTPNFWKDDVQGIIYGDYGHDYYVKIFDVMHSEVWLSGLDDAITYRCFAYSMSLTAEPQYIRIQNSTSAHAMVAYAVDEHQIFVYDPNYPARRDRIVNFKGNTSGSFDPYYSGDNAEEIANGNGRSYDVITYASKSALISNDALENGYKLYQSNNLYDDYFSVEDLELVLKDKENRIIVRSANQELTSSEKEVKLGYAADINNIDEGVIFYNSEFEAISGTVSLNENEGTIIGVYHLGKPNGAKSYDWLGFKWFFVEYSVLDPQLFGTWAYTDSENNYYAWTFNEDGTAIQELYGKQYSWEWIIEEGQIKLFFENGTPAFLTYKIEGNKLYFWAESINEWGAPFTKTS